MEFIRFELREELSVSRLISFSYKELGNDYVHTGEQHDFWEFVYVDKGEVEITTDANVYEMKQGSIVFYKPNAFHSLRTNQVTAPNLFIVSFDCDSPAMAFFENRSFAMDDEERNLLARIVKEGFTVFDPPIDRPRVRMLRRKPEVPFGSEQLIKLYLELLLVQMIRKRQTESIPQRSKLSSTSKENKEHELIERMTEYLRNHLAEELTPERLSGVFSLSRTQLKTIFKARTGCTLTEYVNKLRIEEAKVMIREQSYSYTEIAEKLGYSGIHYFSRQFKKATGMPPTEYARTVKARMLPPN